MKKNVDNEGATQCKMKRIVKIFLILLLILLIVGAVTAVVIVMFVRSRNNSNHSTSPGRSHCTDIQCTYVIIIVDVIYILHPMVTGCH